MALLPGIQNGEERESKGRGESAAVKEEGESEGADRKEAGRADGGADEIHTADTGQHDGIKREPPDAIMRRAVLFLRWARAAYLCLRYPQRAGA